jgi:N-methylhydantoinase A
MVLGILNPDNFLGGKLRLDPGASWKAIEPIAAHFGVSVPEAAAGIYRIGNVHMAQAIVESTVKKGIDPRDFTLVAFGGAGGQHAVEVAREVGIPSVLVPLNPSTFSAFGLLTADLKNTVSRTVLMPLDRLNVDALRVVFRDLETEATRFMAGEERLMTRVSTEYFLDVRYIGQSNEVAVLLPANWLRRDAIYKEFERLHSLLYGTRLSDPAEIVNVRVTVTGIVRPIELAVRRKAPSFRRATAKARRKVAFFPKPIAVFDRDDLDYGMTLREPCILEEVDHTLFVPKGCTVRVDRYRNLFIELPRGARGRIEKLWD